MSVIIKPGVMKYRDPTDGTYKGVDAVAERTTSEQVADVQAAGASQVAAVNAAGQAAQSIIPDQQTFTNLSNDFAPQWASNTAYAAGAYVMHDYKLYRRNVATAGDETFSASDWALVNSGEEITDVKTQISGITGVNIISFTNGSYIKTNESVGSVVNLTPVAGSARNNYAIVSGIASGQKFTINGTGGSTGRLWAFVDENDILLSNAKALANATNLVLTAPDGADKLILNPIDTVLLCTIGEIPKLSIDLLQEHENYENTVIKLQNSDFINGRWQNRQIESVDNRICIYQMIHVRKGDSIIVTQNDLLIYISEYIGITSTAATVLKAFEDVVADGTVIRIAEEGDVLIMLKDSSEADITPNDYDADITVITYTPALYSDISVMDAYKRNGYIDITANDLINGYFLFRTIAANAKSLCYTCLIPVRAGDRIAYKTGTLEFYAGLYPHDSSTIEEIVAWNSAESEKQYFIQADGMLAIRIRNASVTNISPNDFTGYIRVTNDFVSRRDAIDQVYAAEYYGEPIKRHGYNYQEIITIAPGSGNTPNDIAVYGDYIFVGINIHSSTEGIIKVFNKNTHEAVATFTVEGGDHFNLLQFSDEKYDESDLFPLLVINTQKAAPDDGLYLVLRIASDLSGCTVVKKYQFKATDFYLYPQVYFDFENSLAYAICLSDTTAAKYIFYKIDLTAGTFDSETNTTVYSSVDGSIIFQSEIENPGVRQGGQIFEDKIYLMRCDRNSNRYDNAKVYVINKNGINPMIDTVIPLAKPFGRTAEGEGVSMVIENEKPVMYASTTAKIYRIEF